MKGDYEDVDTEEYNDAQNAFVWVVRIAVAIIGVLLAAGIWWANT